MIHVIILSLKGEIKMEKSLMIVVEYAWILFLPFLLICALYIIIQMQRKILKNISKKEKIEVKRAMGSLSVSLGGMVGTGAIIGVLGAIQKLPDGVKPEAIAIWSVVGLILMLPLIYFEVITTKVTGTPVRIYVQKMLGSKLSYIYSSAFIILYVFGFGGLQFSGITDMAQITLINQFNINLDLFELLIYVAVPLFIGIAALVLAKKHYVLINSLTIFITTAVVSYIMFLIYFIVNSGYITIYIENLWSELLNPVSFGIGIPIGLLYGLQRIIQASETGLGSIGMSSLENNLGPRPAAILAIFPTIITVLIAIIGTSFITSYGIDQGLIQEINLAEFVNTVYFVGGKIGVLITALFIMLSGITTLLGSFYYVDILLEKSINIKITLYLFLIAISGIMAIFGFSLVFTLIDLLMFIVVAINIIALLLFAIRGYQEYIIRK